jgi:polyisoprenoid-binding protein YceI
MIRKIFAITLLFGILAFIPVSHASDLGVDAAHSTVGFSVPILGGLSEVQGKFAEFTAAISYDESDVTKSSVDATIKVSSIDTGIAARDKHLLTADFFDAEKYPEITFKSSRVVKKGKQMLVHGTFTMHGVAREIILPIKMTGKFVDPTTKATSYGFSATLKLNRMDYGVSYQRKGSENFLGTTVTIELALLTRPPK